MTTKTSAAATFDMGRSNMARHDALPHSLAPVGLRRPVAAAYYGVSAATFDKLRKTGAVPKPRLILDGIEVWSRYELDEAFHAMPIEAANDNYNPWDSHAPEEA
jgi:predicted DNA-binding transcriptional regulator AlpA